MNRQHGARPIARRSVTQLTALLVAFALGGLGLFLFTSPSARADSATVSMGSGSAGTISLVDGDSVVFQAPSTLKGIPIYNGMNLTGPGVSGTLVKPGKTLSLSFSTSGTRSYTWKSACVCIAPTKGSAAIAVTDPPPPPPPDSSTPAPPDSSTPAGGTSTTPGGGVSTTPGGGVSSTPGGGVSTSPGAHTSTTPGHSGGGGISIGPTIGDTGNNGNNGVPIGFNGPPPDPNHPTPTIPNAIGSGVGQVPTGAAGTSSVPASGPGQRTLVEVADSTPVSKSRPTSLAIISIVALAVVASLFAYRRLGEQAQRPGH